MAGRLKSLCGVERVDAFDVSLGSVARRFLHLPLSTVACISRNLCTYSNTETRDNTDQ